MVPTSCHVVVARSVVEYPVARATSAAWVNRKPFPSAGVSCVGSWTTTGAHDPRRSAKTLRIPRERFETSRLLVLTFPPYDRETYTEGRPAFSKESTDPESPALRR